MVAWSRRLSSGLTAMVECTAVMHGDVSIEVADSLLLEQRRRAVVDLPWSWLRQVHGAEVWAVGEPGAASGREGDGLVTTCSGAALAVQTADCAPVVLVGEPGVLGVAHAGWRGVVAGVIGATVDAMVSFGARDIVAFVGPRIGPECYEFSSADVAIVADAVGEPAVRATTALGRPALDLGRAVVASLGRSGVTDVVFDERCTACSPGLYSHRRRRDRGRQATVAWLSP